MQKVRYELDPHNRLVLKSGRKAGLTRFRKVLDGRFRTDKNNELSYHIKAPLAKSENIPNQVRLRGKWSLTDNHDLRLTLDKHARETFGDKITLRGEILQVGKNSLLFAVTTKTKEGKQSTYTLNLKGSWKADKNNRLTFRVNKEKSRHDILTFRGVWEINKNHRIIYQYEKAKLIRKKRKAHTLTFQGYWDIKDKFRISYVLSKDTDSAFNFRAIAGIFKGNYIKYKLGIGLTNRAKPVKRAITLFGTWKIKKNVSLTFEVKYEDKKVREIVFSAKARRKIMKGDGEAFIRALKSTREFTIYAGAARRW